MFNVVSRKMTNRLMKRKVIKQEDYEIYLFGIEQMLVSLLDFMTCVIIGVVFGELLHTVLFIAAFVGLRSYAGGYHASTPLRCYLLTTGMVVVSVAILKYVSWNASMILGLLVIASVLILIFSPVATENKPIDEVEYVYFRRKARMALLVETIVVLICMIFRFELGAESIVWGMWVIAVALSFEKAKNCKKIQKTM